MWRTVGAVWALSRAESAATTSLSRRLPALAISSDRPIATFCVAAAIHAADVRVNVLRTRLRSAAVCPGSRTRLRSLGGRARSICIVAAAASRAAADTYILGIETSCDDTGAAIVTGDGRILGEALASQVRGVRACVKASKKPLTFKRRRLIRFLYIFLFSSVPFPTL